MSDPRVRFTDGEGRPVSHEYFESIGYTDGLKLTGQAVIHLKCEHSILSMAFRAETKEDFDRVARVLFTQFVKENNVRNDKV